MKYLFLCFFTISSIVAIQLPHQFSTNHSEYTGSELDDMIEIIDEQQLNLSNWQTTIKETQKINDISSFKKKLKGYQLNMVENDSNIKYQSNTQERGGINETVLIVRTSSEKNTYKIIYTISSTDTTTEVLDIYKNRVDSITKVLFTENAQIFSCVEAWKSGIIDIVCFIEFVKKSLDMTIIDEIKDSHFYSWTGFTPEWDESLIQDTEEFNIQIAVREGIGDRTTVTIGTPILINEY
ncbi:YwmB family TATA-box binding protein [Gracilibacillus kekensis]|uniref:TATA-box binding n=1 Tax=Gracilibacillus kekensis TaxID=1027249 RepID=A0A1M7K949_9BACI|nr:YwmB family TATA-box binding protein [Gracilibacillus kekensis]SHM61822.1 TATA-box binding [Gracilibacillus kekensis]